MEGVKRGSVAEYKRIDRKNNEDEEWLTTIARLSKGFIQPEEGHVGELWFLYMGFKTPECLFQKEKDSMNPVT